MIITWDTNKIIDDLRRCYAATTNPHETGFVQWPCKQSLYKVKFALDEMLADCPKFAGEDEWLEEHEKKKMWKALHDEKTD